MKNIIPDKSILIFAGVGAGIGFGLAWLSGANKIGTTLAFATLGGIVGYSGETTSSFSGTRNRFTPQPPPIGGGGA